ncbi:MAG: autotransporter outer membrane beta-barrel domain-containing protein, partial [Deltaproteobacteria bacterium]|nr:autotransporter outer membrane beta-barrel domain-containing protein [Deltaproteobacteria bacterium]
RVFTPRINLGAAFETMDTSISIASRFSEIEGIPAFIGSSPEISRSRLIAEAGADLSLSDRVTVSLDYRGSFRRREMLHSGTLSLKFDF